jgi:hypothetical protein
MSSSPSTDEIAYRPDEEFARAANVRAFIDEYGDDLVRAGLRYRATSVIRSGTLYSPSVHPITGVQSVVTLRSPHERIPWSQSVLWCRTVVRST